MAGVQIAAERELDPVVAFSFDHPLRHGIVRGEVLEDAWRTGHPDSLGYDDIPWWMAMAAAAAAAAVLMIVLVVAFDNPLRHQIWSRTAASSENEDLGRPCHQNTLVQDPWVKVVGRLQILAEMYHSLAISEEEMRPWVRAPQLDEVDATSYSREEARMVVRRGNWPVASGLLDGLQTWPVAAIRSSRGHLHVLFCTWGSGLAV